VQSRQSLSCARMLVSAGGAHASAVLRPAMLRAVDPPRERVHSARGDAAQFAASHELDLGVWLRRSVATVGNVGYKPLHKPQT
jgi:hypothetical protein